MAKNLPTPDSDSHRTRQRLLEAAAGLLSRQGRSDNLLEQAATLAGCEVARARVFFGRDEELVLALYARFAADLEARVLELPQGTVAQRFHATMTIKFAIVERYREALAALTATLLDPRHELGALSPQTEIIRDRVVGVFAAVVHGASDAPPASCDRIIRALYGIHLGLMLLWTQDRSPRSPSARAALDLARDMIGFVAPLLAVPDAAPLAERLDGVFGPLLATEDDLALQDQAKAILRCLFRHRRLLANSGACAAQPCEQCLALHLSKIRYYLRAQRPLHFLLPAFPAKSPSRSKTLGPLPDRAEELALSYLDNVCRELQALHAPGVRVAICSDGHVFSDLVAVADDDVSAYGREIEAQIGRLACDSLEMFSMENLYEGLDFVVMRRHLVEEYARPLEEIERPAHQFDHAQAIINGIQRFLFEEQVDLQPSRSRTQIRHECRSMAYRVVQRSEAWGRLLTDCFPTALRLSIHPQHPHSEKIGMLLGRADDAWLTPWHGAALHTSTGWKFIKADEAAALGARLVEHDGRPYYFELLESTS